MLEDTGFLSVNQMAAYSLLIETWKARQFNVPILSGLLERKRKDNRTLRSDSANKVATIGYDSVALVCERLWNMSSDKFKSTNLVNVAKNEAKILVKTLPL